MTNPQTAHPQGVKFDNGKFKHSLVRRYLNPEFLLGMAEVMDYGAKKYGLKNYMLPMPNHEDRMYDACLRHLNAWLDGEKNDPADAAGSGLDHLFHAACNLMMLWEKEKEQNGRTIS